MTRQRTCPASGKRMLKRHEADRVVTMAGRRAHGLARVPASAYKCPDCGKWHTTGMTQLEYQVLRLVGKAA